MGCNRVFFWEILGKKRGQQKNRVNYYPGGATFNSYTSGTKNKFLYQGKEEQSALGTYDFGLRMYDPYIVTTWQIDPGAEFYYSQSPYSWAAGNPIKFIDPTGAFTELFDQSGNKIGEDENGNDGNVSIITNKADVKRIKKNTKNGQLATADDIAGSVQTTKAVLGEALDVLDRTEANGGLREESSIVMNDGQVVREGTGDPAKIEGGFSTATTKVPNLPEGTTDADVVGMIHSHPTEAQIEGGVPFLHSANKPSAADKRTFKRFGTNIIVGPLGVVNSVTQNPDGSFNLPSRSNGAVIYNRGAVQQTQLKTKAIKKIIQ